MSRRRDRASWQAKEHAWGEKKGEKWGGGEREGAGSGEKRKLIIIGSHVTVCALMERNILGGIR